MSFSYLTPENVCKRYKDAKTFSEQATLPFPEFQRIAQNRPIISEKDYPNVTDGTTASIIRKTPRRIVQQLPSGSVVTDDGGWLGVVADFILQKRILPFANDTYDLIQKSWNVIETGLTFGMCATYTPFLDHDGYLCPDLSVIYWGDIILPPGKKSAYASPYFFIRSWWQPSDIDALIDREAKLAASAKKRGEKYDSTWDVKALKQARSKATAKDIQARTPVEKDRAYDEPAVELVTAFQKGVKAKFFTFNPATELVVRTETNKDPRGKAPVDFFYGDIDGTNPFGRGIVELVGGLQNLIDSDMQAYQYNRALLLDPPVLVKNMNKNKVVYAPGALIDAGANPNADAIPLKIDTTAIANYPALYGLQKSQLLNLVNSPDTSISSQVGNPNFSKTTAGVNAQQATISVDDNYVEKMFEAWFEHQCETFVNQYFAKRKGVEELQLDKETAQKLRELPGFDQTLLSDDNKIRLDYDTDTPALKFRVNPSTSRVKDNASQVQDAQALLDLIMKYPMLNKNFGGPIDSDVLARRIVVNSGIDDPEQVAPEPTPAEIESKKLQRNQINPFSPFFDKPTVSIAWEQIPPTAQLDLLRNAGATSVTIQDILNGPVANINARGNTALNKPLDDPNQLMPGGQAGGANAGVAQQIDYGDIYKGTTDPAVKAQIEQMAGLQPDPQNLTDQMATNQTQHAANQAKNMNQAGLNPQDVALVNNLRRLGLSDSAIQQVIAQLEQGVPIAQIQKQLTGGQGGR